MKKMAHLPWWLAWALPILWTLATWTMSGSLGTPVNTFAVFHWVISWFTTSLDPDTLNLYHFYCRKALHAICYGFLAILWFRALMATWPRRFGANIMAALALALAVAALDEGRQYFAPSRTPSFWDIGLDIAGGIFFLSLFAAGWKISHRPSAGVPPPTP